MQKFGLNELREMFLKYFSENGHLTVKSYPLIPQEDKTLLFIVAGMVPLKNYFSGITKPPQTRMATVQKCIRTNDIDNVGYTARHASFFEMLGNFSFGDYFKKEAINLAWKFSVDVIGLPKDRIWASVYVDDDEAFEIWKNEVGMPEDRIVRLTEDNFWEIGTGTGPCGPCSELFFDRGEEHGCGNPNCKPGCECDRYVEYWNLVFTQFDKQSDGSLVPLANPNIDTGMGLERLACIIQEVDSIFDIDTFRTIISKIEEISGKTYGKVSEYDICMRVITDHIRSVTMICSEGVVPDNEGRGYVLRMLFRRAVRRARLLGINENFMAKLADVVIDVYGDSYSELKERRDYIRSIVEQEEERFVKTLDSGMKILESMIDEMETASCNVLSGENAFKLHDTYGFPLDLTKDILREKNYEVDDEAFNQEMENQKKRARSARSKGGLGWDDDSMTLFPDIPTNFVGYSKLESESEILFITKSNEEVKSVSTSNQNEEIVYIMLDSTPFYAESGGQVSDNGKFYADGFEADLIELKKLPGKRWIHGINIIQGSIKVGDKIKSVTNYTRRFDIMKNHSVTHLMHQALKDVLGPEAAQAGSLVDEYKTRFDFTHNKAMTSDEIRKVEDIVNQKIFEQLPIVTDIMNIDDARKKGAMALFGEKYEDVVRVVSMGDYSIELCGGTHVSNTSDIGIFKIASESAAAAGIRRIEGITGRAVYEILQDQSNTLNEIVSLTKSQSNNVVSKVTQILEEKKELQNEIKNIRAKNASDDFKDLKSKFVDIKGVQVLSASFEELDSEVQRNLADDLVNIEKAAVVVIAGVSGDKVSFVVKANKLALDMNVHCGKIAKELAATCGGGGGGRADMAQAGGKDSSKLNVAFEKLNNLI